MTALAISRRDRRTLAVGAVTVATLVLLARGVPALRAWTAGERDAAATLTAQLASARESVSRERATVDTFRTRARAYVSLAPAVIPGGSPAVAAAALGSIVSGAAQGVGLTVGAVQATVDSGTVTWGGKARASSPRAFVPVRVRADATGDVRGVTDFLAALERGPVLLRVRELSITQPEPAAPSERREALHVEVVVDALGLISAPRDSTGSAGTKTERDTTRESR